MPLEKPTKPDAITAVPTPVPLRTDRANFAARGDAMMGWFPDGVDEINTTSDYMDDAANFAEQEANEAEASATAAAASNAAAAVNAAAAAASAGAILWVTGSTYTAGVVRYSPTNFQTYRDTVGGLSSTDPASDTTGRWISAMLPSAEAIGLPAMPPTAVFNFAAGVIDRRFVEQRSTAGTRYNIFGNLETLAAGVAKPTHDPATNECKGYLASPATTYLPMRSTEMDNASYWVQSNVTVTPAAARGIDGALSAYKIEATATAATTYYRAAVATATSQYFTVRAKKGSSATAGGRFAAYNTTTAADLVGLTFNYDTGVITQTVGTGAAATEAGDGFWDIYVPITSGISIGNNVLFYAGFIGGPQTAGDFCYVCAPDVADKPKATHEPTAGSNVTRTAGGLVLDLAAHTEVINPRGFTAFFAIDASNLLVDTTEKILLSLGVDASNEIYINANAGSWRVIGVIGGVGQFSTALGSVVAGRNVLAVSMQGGACLGVVTGGAVVSLGTMSAMPSMPELYVGRYARATGFEPNAPIEIVAVYPRACTAGELRAFVNNF